MKRNFKCLIQAISIIALSALIFIGCGKSEVTGIVNPQIEKVDEDSIDEALQIVELNNSMDYYLMEINANVSNVYFYSIGYDGNGRLIDKSVITTMPTGMEKSERVVLNSTFPKATNPSYAVGFLMEDNTQEFYILDYDKKGNLKSIFVENNEDFMISE